VKICITGGGGYVGTVLTALLVSRGHFVKVLDKFWFGDRLPLGDNIYKITGDIRKRRDLEEAFSGCDAVVHLACISNDPSFELNPEFGKSINLDCFESILSVVKESKVKRFIYASSSSIYGISDLENVTEEAPKNPLTDYSRHKLTCENLLKTIGTNGEWTILRPATVCGYSPRLRLDLVVNILTIQAVDQKRIKQIGRDQKRPNIHIADMCEAYSWALEADAKIVDQQVFNVGFENLTIREIALLVKQIVGNPDVTIEEIETNDPRSYHINSQKILDAGFVPQGTIAAAINSLKDAYEKALILRNSFSVSKYSNIETMKLVRMK
jgi:nucleoside-diphosphate-sugar epimerase